MMLPIVKYHKYHENNITPCIDLRNVRPIHHWLLDLS